MRKMLFRTRLFDLERHTLRIKGKLATFYRIGSPNTSVIIPLLEDGRVILERQYRPAIGRYLYELPAGHLNRKEKPASAARRELEEETGYRAGSLRLLFEAYPSPGIKTEFSSFYLATNLTRTKTNLDTDEVITIKKIKLSRLVGMIRSNRIVDAKTIAAVLFYTAFSKPSR